MINMNDKEMMFQLLEGETLGKEIMCRYTNHEKLKVAIPYMMAILIRASKDKKLTTELFITMSKMYEELLNTKAKP
jgi:hypothetical protein